VQYGQQMSFFRRVRAFLLFVFRACRFANQFTSTEVCYVTSTPLTVGLIALYLKWKMSIPYYFEVRDLWPEAPIQLGYLKSKLLIALLRRFEKEIYRCAKGMVVLSPEILKHVRQLVPTQQVLLIPNLSACDFFAKTEKNPYHEYQFDVEGKFVVTYFGAVGKVNRLEHFLETAKLCENQCPEIVFLLAGEGSELPRIRQMAQAMGLSNLRFVPFQNKYGLLSLLNITDMVYITFDNHPVLQANSPNKFFDALAAGKPCAVTLPGWLNHLVESNDCGFYFNPDVPQTFVEKVIPFITDSNYLASCKANARHLAEREFDKEMQIQKLATLICPEPASAAKAYTLHA
jgi:glycosyltransferase involved in cell wall biosynthesis